MSAQINLLPKKDLSDSLLGKILEFSLTYGRYIIVVTQLVVLLAFFSRFTLDRELSDLQDSIEQKKQIVVSLQNFEVEVRELQTRLTQINKLKTNHDITRESLQSVRKSLPEGNAATNISISGGKVEIKGLSENAQTLAELFDRARRLKGISSVEFGDIGKSEDSDKIAFDLSFELEGVTYEQSD